MINFLMFLCMLISALGCGFIVVKGDRNSEYFGAIFLGMLTLSTCYAVEVNMNNGWIPYYWGGAIYGVYVIILLPLYHMSRNSLVEIEFRNFEKKRGIEHETKIYKSTNGFKNFNSETHMHFIEKMTTDHFGEVENNLKLTYLWPILIFYLPVFFWQEHHQKNSRVINSPIAKKFR